MVTRREMLKATVNGAAMVSLCPTVPAFLAKSACAAVPDRDGRVLVVIQLDGGNDAINTLVPFTDDGYARNRKVLRLPGKNLIKVNDGVGLHPAFRAMGNLLERGQLALVPGVGYPNPNRSHFESMAIWQTARLEPDELDGPGWIGRGSDERFGKGMTPDPAGGSALFIGEETPPAALRGRRSSATSLDRIEDMTVPAGWVRSQAWTEPTNAPAAGDDLEAFVRRSVADADATAERINQLSRTGATGADVIYPSSALATKLQTVSRLLKVGLPARVFYTIQSGYDTHAGQANTHAGLLNELAGALKAFLDDLAAARLAERVTVLCFSEFGRRLAENGSAGTDHGTAGLVLLAGPGVLAGVHGKVPSLTNLIDGDPRITTDFRQVYAAVLENWLGLPYVPSVGSKFEPIPLFRPRLIMPDSPAVM